MKLVSLIFFDYLITTSTIIFDIIILSKNIIQWKLLWFIIWNIIIIIVSITVRVRAVVISHLFIYWIYIGQGRWLCFNSSKFIYIDRYIVLRGLFNYSIKFSYRSKKILFSYWFFQELLVFLIRLQFF